MLRAALVRTADALATPRLWAGRPTDARLVLRDGHSSAAARAHGFAKRGLQRGCIERPSLGAAIVLQADHGCVVRRGTVPLGTLVLRPIDEAMAFSGEHESAPMAAGLMQLVPSSDLSPCRDDDHEGQRSRARGQQLLHVLDHLAHQLRHEGGVRLEGPLPRPKVEKAPERSERRVGVFEGGTVPAVAAIQRRREALEANAHSLAQNLEAIASDCRLVAGTAQHLIPRDDTPRPREERFVSIVDGSAGLRCVCVLGPAFVRARAPRDTKGTPV
mmetsp:Transcript_89691/g.252880  ORF Transcript_89691/g.252880 Transcript_89691/m.252880 type:complete len:273 (+) Transcript_89691:262-1080(+)